VVGAGGFAGVDGFDGVEDPELPCEEPAEVEDVEEAVWVALFEEELAADEDVLATVLVAFASGRGVNGLRELAFS